MDAADHDGIVTHAGRSVVTTQESRRGRIGAVAARLRTFRNAIPAEQE